MPERPWADEYTLLCERCGYVVEGLDPAGACPECGKPIAESLPERRVGTPWQQHPSPVTLLCSWAMTIRRPNRVLQTLSASADRGIASLLVVAAVLTPIATVAIRPLIVHTDARPTPSSRMLGIAAMWPVEWLIAIAGGLSLTTLLLVASWIERRGLMFFGARRGLRVTRDVAISVCDHGCAGWAVALITASIATWVHLFWHLRFGWFSAWVRQAHIDRYLWLGGSLFAISLAPGFLFFEVFAYLGLRRCKFANRQKPGADASGSFGPTTNTQGKEPGA